MAYLGNITSNHLIHVEDLIQIKVGYLMQITANAGSTVYACNYYKTILLFSAVARQSRATAPCM